MTVTTFAQLSFHDSTLAGVLQDGETVRLSVVDLEDDQPLTSATIVIEGVRRVLRLGVPIQQLAMETADGEILALREENGGVLLAVIWHTWEPARLRADIVYNLVGGRIASIE